MKKILGILGLLLAIFVVTWIVEPKFVSAYNLQNIIRWTSLFGIISIGVAFVIITGGIDLSIGSLIGLVGCLLPMLLAAGYSPVTALVAVVVLSLAIGLMHGLLITRLGLQPFCRDAVRSAVLSRLCPLAHPRPSPRLWLVLRGPAPTGDWQGLVGRRLCAADSVFPLATCRGSRRSLPQPHDMGPLFVGTGPE